MTTPPTPTRRIDVERLRGFLDSMVHPGLYDVEYNGHLFSWAAALAELEAARAVVEAARRIRVAIPSPGRDDFGLRSVVESVAAYDRAEVERLRKFASEEEQKREAMLQERIAVIGADRDAPAERCREYKREWESSVERADSSEHLRKEAEARAEAAEAKLRHPIDGGTICADDYWAERALRERAEHESKVHADNCTTALEAAHAAEARAARLAAVLSQALSAMEAEKDRRSPATEADHERYGQAMDAARAALAADTAEKEKSE